MPNEDLLLLEIRELKTGQEKMAKDIHQIKEAVYNPDNGLFSRVKANTVFRQLATWLGALLLTGLAATMWQVFLAAGVGR